MICDHFQLRGATGLVTSEAVECGTCGTPHYMFINRAGSTRCTYCDADALANNPLVAEVAAHLFVAEYFRPVETA